MDKATKAPKLNVRNWECGVLIPVYAATTDKDKGFGGAGRGKSLSTNEGGAGVQEVEGAERTGPVAMDVVGQRVPVPMVWPGRRIDGGGKPWFYSENS